MVLIARCLFWLSLALVILGCFVSFYPGAETDWFLLSGAVIAAGFLVPKRRYRIAASLLCCVCLLNAYSGYQRASKHQQWLQDRNSSMLKSRAARQSTFLSTFTITVGSIQT